MGSEYSYVMTEKAILDIDEIIQYLSETLANPNAAKNFYDEMEETIKRIVSFPKSGSPVINTFLKRNDIRSVNIKNYLMYYFADTKQKKIYIVRVVYSRRDMTGILRRI